MKTLKNPRIKDAVTMYKQMRIANSKENYFIETDTHYLLMVKKTTWEENQYESLEREHLDETVEFLLQQEMTEEEKKAYTEQKNMKYMVPDFMK